jgi:uncharacterized Fe-S cluster protein YjdI
MDVITHSLSAGVLPGGVTANCTRAEISDTTFCMALFPLLVEYRIFDPRKRPWVTAEGGTTQQIVDQIKKCPSGALSYFMNAGAEGEIKVDAETIVETMTNGPLLVYGNVTVKDAAGNLTKKNNVTAFCRCGGSGNKPFCDGSHKRIDFKG